MQAINMRVSIIHAVRKGSCEMSVYNNNVKNKLLVMYFIKTMNTPLLGYQIEDYFVDNVLIEIIELHTILSELTEMSFIKIENSFDRQYYKITEKGKDALESLESDLTETSRALINDYCKENRSKILNMNNIITACKQVPDGFELTLTLLNNAKPFMEIRMMIDDEEFAINASKNWEQSSNDIYASIINMLLN